MKSGAQPHHLMRYMYVKIYISVHPQEGLRLRIMVFNTTFNKISVILWQSVLLVEEIRVSGENHCPATSH
jgi:hypothetical protein